MIFQTQPGFFLKIFPALFYVSGVSGSDQSYYTPPCSVTNVFENITAIRVNQKNTYALFTPHLTNEAIQIIGLIKGDYEETRQNLRIFLVHQRAKVRSEKKDVSVIVSFLSSKPTIKWIGIEASEQEMENKLSIKQQLEDYFNMKKVLKDDIKMNGEETDSLLHLMYSAYVIALSKNPELFRSIRFIPIDDSFYKEETLVLIENNRQIRKRIIDRSKRISLPFSEFEKIEEVQYGALNKMEKISKQQITTVLSRLSDTELKALVNEYFSSMNTFLENSSKRDKTMAAIVSKQSGEGLIILGSAHRRGTIEHLLSLCRGL